MTICASEMNTQSPPPRLSIGMRPRLSMPEVNIVVCSSFCVFGIEAGISGFFLAESAFCGCLRTFLFLDWCPDSRLEKFCFSFMISYFKQRILGYPRVITKNMKKITLITKPLILSTFYLTSTSVTS